LTALPSGSRCRSRSTRCVRFSEYRPFRWFPSIRLEIPETPWDGTAIRVRRRDLEPLLDAIEAGRAAQG
jgi:hypothetical protein